MDRSIDLGERVLKQLIGVLCRVKKNVRKAHMGANKSDTLKQKCA
jgi:hypothetical protein